MRRTRIAIALVLSVLSLPPAAEGQDPGKLAQARLDYLVGSWDATTEFFDAAGDIIRTDTSLDVIEPLIGDKVLMTTVITPDGTIRKTMRFYDQAEERYYEIGVGEAGDVWILSGEMDAYVTTSQVRSTPDGGRVMVRFTHTNIEPNSFDAFMEVSRDEGETWTRANMIQRMVRRTQKTG